MLMVNLPATKVLATDHRGKITIRLTNRKDYLLYVHDINVVNLN